MLAKSISVTHLPSDIQGQCKNGKLHENHGSTRCRGTCCFANLRVTWLWPLTRKLSSYMAKKLHVMMHKLATTCICIAVGEETYLKLPRKQNTQGFKTTHRHWTVHEVRGPEIHRLTNSLFSTLVRNNAKYIIFTFSLTNRRFSRYQSAHLTHTQMLCELSVCYVATILHSYIPHAPCTADRSGITDIWGDTGDTRLRCYTLPTHPQETLSLAPPPCPCTYYLVLIRTHSRRGLICRAFLCLVCSAGTFFLMFHRNMYDTEGTVFLYWK